MTLSNTTGNQDRALENEVRSNPEADYSTHADVLEDLDKQLTDWKRTTGCNHPSEIRSKWEEL